MGDERTKYYNRQGAKPSEESGEAAGDGNVAGHWRRGKRERNGGAGTPNYKGTFNPD